MWRVGFIVKNTKETFSQNFNSKLECEEWLLEQSEKHNIKTSVIWEKGNIKTRTVERW